MSFKKRVAFLLFSSIAYLKKRSIPFFSGLFFIFNPIYSQPLEEHNPLSPIVIPQKLADDRIKGTEDTLQIPLGLPTVPWPADNPYSKKKAELGRLLYFDKRLSSDGTISCSTCHSIPRAFTDHQAVSIGIGGRRGTRHAPTVINAAYLKNLFWDGRAKSLEDQSTAPLANRNEMTDADTVHDAHLQCQKRIFSYAGYRKLFREAFNSDEMSITLIAQAIATFERTILSGNAPYDRYIAGHQDALTPDQIKGYQLFSKVGCINCHLGFNFSNGGFANIGIGMDKQQPDLGRYDVTKEKKDWGAFKVPILREVASTYPYMHDGSLKTLDDVVEYYDQGGIKNKNLHPLMKPLHLSPEDKKAIVSFLQSLSGEGWQHFTEPTYFPQ